MQRQIYDIKKHDENNLNVYRDAEQKHLMWKNENKQKYNSESFSGCYEHMWQNRTERSAFHMIRTFMQSKFLSKALWLNQRKQKKYILSGLAY